MKDALDAIEATAVRMVIFRIDAPTVPSSWPN